MKIQAGILIVAALHMAPFGAVSLLLQLVLWTVRPWRPGARAATLVSAAFAGASAAACAALMLALVAEQRGIAAGMAAAALGLAFLAGWGVAIPLAIGYAVRVSARTGDA